MFRHILIATDGSELASKAATAGLQLAKHLQAKATAVTATQPWMAVVTGEAALGFPLAEYEKAAAETAARILSAVRDAANGVGVACAVVHAKGQYPAESILATAKASGCDLIVMASPVCLHERALRH
jgi:nucleotide-binding universal stress UspA family protein